MKRKVEDRLAMLAFGDLPKEEAERLKLQAESDPETSKTYATYCRMKEELTLLSDVPEDQLSKERLRQAILARGLKEHQPKTQRPTWIWMPIAAAACAFGLMYVKGQVNVKPVVTRVVDQSDGTKLPGLTSFNFETTQSRLNKALHFGGAEASRPVIQEVSNIEPSYHRHSSPLASRGDFEPRGPGERVLSGSSLEGNGIVSGALELKGEADPPNLTPSASKEIPATVVVIQPETDSVTGTHKATEVQNTSNVVVGG